MKKALLVIDAQKIYSLKRSAYYVDGVDVIVKNINCLIDKFNQKGEMVIYIKHEHNPNGEDAGRMFDFAGENDEIEFKRGSEEAEYIDELTVIENSPLIIKNRYDAFIGTSLETLLKINQIEKLVICGFMTNFCCESTARHAHDLDYYVDFVIDAMGSPGTETLSSKDVNKATAATIGEGFAVVINTEET